MLRAILAGHLWYKKQKKNIWIELDWGQSKNKGDGGRYNEAITNKISWLDFLVSSMRGHQTDSKTYHNITREGRRQHK